ncbi:D-glycero-beta-D-manno-heptose-7-phosphate kinase [Bacillus sp. FJAT-29937]|uniref:D-glycero-beta-D-manno-heptose-7-phosphate kinase n=1 Tax=Bacillus sp. FJAT-29937 TaxID=1720553 RepID=UPI00082A44B3|nr:D-glycero-beta-D-manno-heptose-7-phosphate kinase [Bacillus sp. FJAT-29937]
MIKNGQYLIQLFKTNVQNCHVLVIGDVMLDKYYFGEMKRISPEAPVPIVNKKDEMTTLGGAANVANNLVQLGCKVSLVGAVGNDQGGNEFFDLLKLQGIDSSGIIIDDRCTTIKTRVMSGNQQVLRIDHEVKMNISDLAIKHLESWLVQKLKKDHITSIIISDYEKGFCRKEICQKVITLANQLEIPIIIDPKGNKWDKYQNATVVTPNMTELSNILGAEIPNTNEVMYRYGPLLRKKYALDYLLVTRSGKGMSLIGEDEITHIFTLAKEVFDVSGAGDTVVSTLAAFLGIGARMDDAVNISNLAAGIVVGKVGTYAVQDDELLMQLEFLSENKNKLSSKVFFNEEYKQVISNWRREGKKIIFTNGCFDILHIGHATYLKKAKQLGDKLVIGLNSDHSVKRLKGPSRPIVNENDRAKMLTFFEFVDAVIIFNEDTPLNLISEIRPDILVKGGDYKAKEVVGREFASKTEIISFVDGYSTSDIIDKISN